MELGRGVFWYEFRIEKVRYADYHVTLMHRNEVCVCLRSRYYCICLVASHSSVKFNAYRLFS